MRRAVPDGHTFKGFPIHFLHRNARRAFATCLRYLHSKNKATYNAFFIGMSLKTETVQRSNKKLAILSSAVSGQKSHCSFKKDKRLKSACFLMYHRSPFCEEIVCCRGDHVRLAVRVRVFAYPESACAVWIMFACKYRSVL